MEQPPHVGSISYGSSINVFKCKGYSLWFKKQSDTGEKVCWLQQLQWDILWGIVQLWFWHQSYSICPTTELWPERVGVHGGDARTSSPHFGGCVLIGDGDTLLWDCISANILPRWSMVGAIDEVGDGVEKSARYIYIYLCGRA